MNNYKVNYKQFYEKYKELVFNLALNYSANKEDADSQKKEFKALIKEQSLFAPNNHLKH